MTPTPRTDARGGRGIAMPNFTVSGPFFDGRADKAAEDATRAMARSIAILGAADIRAVQDRTFRVQTPYARLQTEAIESPPGWKIWMQHVVYRFWLEGTGSRNKTSRFKGYWIFRTAFGRINMRAQNMGNSVMVRFMGRMN